MRYGNATSILLYTIRIYVTIMLWETIEPRRLPSEFQFML